MPAHNKQPSPRPDLIDKKVIDGHVIPNKVIFTSSAAIDEPYYTLAFEDNLKVTVSFFTQQSGKETKSKFFFHIFSYVVVVLCMHVLFILCFLMSLPESSKETSVN